MIFFLSIVTTEIYFKMSIILIRHLDITIVYRVRLVSTHNTTHTLVDQGPIIKPWVMPFMSFTLIVM